MPSRDRHIYPLLAVMLALACLLAFSSCKRGGGGEPRAKSSLGRTVILPNGSTRCPHGGIVVETGLDENANGILESNEVTSTSPICNPQSNAPGGLRPLVKIESLPTGTCPAGGLRILAGPDADADGTLEPAEVVFADYLCSATTGTTVAGVQMAAGGAFAPVRESRKTEARIERTPPKVVAPRKEQPRQAARPKPERTRPAEARKVKEAPPAPRKAAPAAAEQPVQVEAPKPAPVAAPSAPPGWTAVTVNPPDLGKVAYKLEGRIITVRFENSSKSRYVRFTYTVRWKENRNGRWVEDSTMEGIRFRLRPLDQLDKETRTQSTEIKDITVEVSANEAD